MSDRPDRLLLTARSVRHLHWRQIWARCRRSIVGRPRLRPPLAKWDADRATEVLGALGGLGPIDTEPHVRAAVRAWRNGRLEALGLSQPVPRTWREPQISPLFAYHLQYHDVLADAAWVAKADGDPVLIEGVRASLAAWRSAWGTGGPPAWDPYPLAVRSMNWLRMMAWNGIDRGDEALQDLLAQQCDVLARDLEWHLEGNHLLRDGWALAVVAACYRGRWAAKTWRRGCELFWAVLLQQVDEDGVHEERSPMYQARILRDAIEVLVVHDALGQPVPPEGRTRIARMAGALQWMRHADGSLRLVNDSAGDHGVDLDRLIADAARVTGQAVPATDGVWGPGSARFVAVHGANGADRLFLDAGAPAPVHQPGHAHAGALSFELDLGGRAVVVDGGCSGYDGDPWRPYFRGTAAHSTLVIDGRDQSELWATFRVARRARVDPPRVTMFEGGVEILGRCHPYHLEGAVHERVVRQEGAVTVITDRVDGANGHRLESFLHFDPAWAVEQSADDSIVLSQEGARVVVRISGAPSWSLHRGEGQPRLGWRARGFNRVGPAWSLRLSSPTYDGTQWQVMVSPA